jgi:hypothetical protein
MSDKESYREKIRILIGFKLQYPLEEDKLSFIQRFEKDNPWMINKPVVVLLKAGQVDRAFGELEKQLSGYRFNMTGHTKEEYANVLGFSLDELGDPEDKRRREEHRAKHDRTKWKLESPDKK